MISNFWWGGSEDLRNIHWRKLSEVAKPKSQGEWGSGSKGYQWGFICHTVLDNCAGYQLSVGQGLEGLESELSSILRSLVLYLPLQFHGRIKKMKRVGAITNRKFLVKSGL